MRLHPRCHVIRSDGDVLLCRGRERIRLTDPAHRDVLERALEALEPETAGSGQARLGLDVVAVVAELEAAGFLVPDAGPTPWLVPGSTPDLYIRHVSAHVAVTGDGPAAQAVVHHLTRAGVRVTRDPECLRPSPVTGVDLLVHCPDGPDLAGLGRINEDAHAGGTAWLPVFHLGEEGIIGPLAAHGGACFRCWELRWLGLADSTASEVRLHRHLRAGGWRRETGREADALAYLGAQAARVAGAWLSGGISTNSVLIADFATGRATEHVMAAHPSCGVCAPVFTETAPPASARGWTSEPDVPGRMPDFTALADERVGAASLVEVQATVDPSRETTPLSIVHARFAVPQPEDAGEDSPGWTHGAGATTDAATLVALAEAIERYCGVYVPRPALSARYRELGETALWPPALPLYSERQYARPAFPFRPFDPDERLDWAWGYAITQDRAVLVPQAAVRYGPLESRLVHESSSGVAAHTSPAAALLGACLEAVERDALMIFWLNRLSPPLIDLEVHDPFVAAAIAEIRGCGYQLDLADMTTDLGLPVVLAIARRTDLAGPALMLGAGAAPVLLTAVIKALRELLGGIRGLFASAWAAPHPIAAEDVRELADHARLYHHPAALPRAAFLWSSAIRTVVTEAGPVAPGVAEQLGQCITSLRGAGLDLIAADLTTPDVAPHLRVFRAIVPGLQPIGFGRHGVRLGGRRLYTVPASLGYVTEETTEESLNADPHCYP